MAAERSGPRRPEETPEDRAASPVAPGKTNMLARLLTLKWLVVLVLVSLVAHGAGFAYLRLRERPSPAPSSPEVTLGTFHFEADRTEAGRTSKADFSLYVALMEPVEQAARERLESRKFRIRQDVEELLRKAHSGDFDDPGMRDLKRQLLEQVNQTLGMRGISDVMITDLKLQRDGRPSGTVASSAEPQPTADTPTQ